MKSGLKLKLKPIPSNTVVHTPTEEEAKELLSILHENGYKWKSGSDSLFNSIHYIAKEGFCIEDGRRLSTCLYISSAIEDKCTILTLAKFKERYILNEDNFAKSESEKPQPKFKEEYVIEEEKPKFEIGDWVIHNHKNRELGQIVAYYPDEKFCYAVRFGKEHHNMAEHQLLLYTEPETKPTEDMETKDEAKEAKGGTKELNLCELLRGHEGEIFYSLIEGDVELKGVSYSLTINCGHLNYHITGHLKGRSLDGTPLLFPSRKLYEQYPLDPYTAWMKWQEEQRTYEINISIDYCENFMGAVDATTLTFRTPSNRDKCIEEIKAIIEKYSKK